MPTTCIPVGVGVPWAGGPPDWWDTAAAGGNPALDDPHWNGTFEQTFGAGGTTQASFRAVNSGGKLYLSWVTLLDNSISTQALDKLWVGLSAGVGSSAVLLNLAVPGPASEAAANNYAPTVYYMPSGGTAWTAATSPPSWLTNNTRLWVSQPQGSGYGIPLPIPWAYQMVVPLGTNLDERAAGNVNVVLPTSGPFKMWFSVENNLDQDNPGGPAEISVPIGVLHNTVFASPDLTQWADYQAAVTPNDPGCTTTGITIQYSDIGTTDPNGTARADQYAIHVDLDLSHNPPNASDANSNVFFARPEFPGNPPDSEKQNVRARFRLANFGSTPQTPNDLSWHSINGGQDVHYDTTSTPQQCHFQWPTPAEVASDLMVPRFRLPTTDLNYEQPHQCVLVELSSVQAEVFIRDSLFVNMHVVNGSTVTRDANIDVRGLAPLGLEPRDVLLYLQTFNMPATIEEDGSEVMNADRLSAFRDYLGNHSVDDLAAQLPSYVVHSFYDTGERTNESGTLKPIWRPMTSFGFFVTHEGAPLTGWNAMIQGAKRIAQNIYLLEVPNASVAKVTTVVQALEAGDTPIALPPIEAWPGPKPVTFPIIAEKLDTVEDIVEASINKVVGPTLGGILDTMEDTAAAKLKSIFGIVE